MPVRLFKDGGKSVIYAQDGRKMDKEKDKDYLKFGDMELSRQGILDTSRDTNFTSEFFNKYKGFGGPRQREKIIRRRNQMINGVLNGSVSLEGINTFVSSMPELSSDGKTKRRFLSNTYNTKDENTLNALAAAAALEVFKNSGYKPKEAEPLEGDKNNDGKVDDKDKDKYDTSFANYLKNKGLSAEGVASAAATRDEAGRYRYLSQLYGDYANSLAQARDSGKYSPETDWGGIDVANRVLAGLKDKAAYEANRDYIDLNSRDADFIRAILGYVSPTQKEDQKKEELTPEQKRQQELTQRYNEANLAYQNMQMEDNIEAMENARKAGEDYDAAWEILSAYINNPERDASTVSGYTIGNSAYNPLMDKATLYINPSVGENAADYWKGMFSSILRDFQNRGSDVSVQDWMGQKLGDNYFGNAGIQDWFHNDPKNNNIGSQLASIRGFREAYQDMTKDQLLSFIMRQLGNYGGVGITGTFSGGPVIDTYTGNDFRDTGVFYGDNKGLHYTPIADAYNSGVVDNAALQAWVRDYMNKKYNVSQVSQQKNGGKIPFMQTGGIVYDNVNYGNMGINPYYSAPSGMVGQIDSDDIREAEANRRRWAEQQQNLQARLKGKPASAGDVKTELSDEDYARIAGAAFNLASAVAAITGFSPLSAGIGLAGTVSNAYADFADDDVSFGNALGNTALNLGLDLVGLIPFAGAATGTMKAVRTIRSLLPVLSLAGVLNNAPEVVDLAKKAITDTSRMTNQDWIDLANGVSAIAGLTSKGVTAGKAHVRAKRSFYERSEQGKRPFVVKAKDANGREVYLAASPDEYNKIAKAKGKEAKQAAFKEIYGEDSGFELRGNPSREIYSSDMRYNNMRPFSGPRTYSTFEYSPKSGRLFRKIDGKIKQGRFGKWLDGKPILDPLGEQGVAATKNTVIDRPFMLKRWYTSSKDALNRFGRRGDQNNTSNANAGQRQDNASGGQPASNASSTADTSTSGVTPTATTPVAPVRPSIPITPLSRSQLEGSVYRTSGNAPVNPATNPPSVGSSGSGTASKTSGGDGKSGSSTGTGTSKAEKKTKPNGTDTRLSRPEGMTKDRSGNTEHIYKQGDVYYIQSGNTKTLQPVTNPSDINLFMSLEKQGKLKFKKGGIVPVGRFKNGGAIYRYNGGGTTTRNTFTAGSPLDYAGFNNLWAQTTGKNLLEALNSTDNGGLDWDTDKWINTANSLQGTYKGAVDVSGNGYDQTDIGSFGEVGKHQENYNTNWARGNKAIEDAITSKLITRRGSTGDNAKGSYKDNLHGLMDSLRTWGYAASDADRKAFESSDIYKQIQAAAGRRGMVYKPIASLSGNGKYYYGFEKMPEPEAQDTKPVKSTPPPATSDPTKVDTPDAPMTTETNPANLEEEAGIGDGTGDGNGASGRVAAMMTSLIEPIWATRVSNQATKQLMRAVRPNLVTAYSTNGILENDYFAKRDASNAGARTNFTADRIASSTADGALGAAVTMQGMSEANKLIAAGDKASRDRFYKTRENVLEHENANKARWTQAANINRKEMNFANLTREQLDAQNKINRFQGIWGPWLRERRALAMQDAVRRMQADSAASAYDMQSELAGLRGDKTDEEWQKYLTSPEYAKAASEIRSRYAKQNLNRSVYDYMTPLFAKRGAKIKSTYELNSKSLDEWSRNYFRMEMKNKDDNTKRLIASSSGWMNYMKMLSDNVNNFNKLIKYVKPR